MGHLRHRAAILEALADLPQAALATDAEALQLIDRHALFGRGIGYVDIHVLAAVLLTPGARLWTNDRRLHAVATDLGLAVSAPGH